MSVINFTDVTPPARYDGIPWTAALVSEGATATGPWTIISTITLSPVDSDPTSPQNRDLTSTAATLTAGFYTITFQDGVGNTSQASDPIQNAPSVSDEIRPTVNELAAFMPARTVVKGSGGTEGGVFTSQTRPTPEEAEGQIDLAVNAVLSETGPNVPARYYPQVKWSVLLYAASLVEVAFYRNEVNRDQSAYAQYQALYQASTKAILSLLRDEDPDAVQAPFWSVPVLNASQQHWQTIFAAMDPTTGNVDPSKLGPEEYYPMGWGGIPPALQVAYPWLFGGAFDAGLAFLED